MYFFSNYWKTNCKEYKCCPVHFQSFFDQITVIVRSSSGLRHQWPAHGDDHAKGEDLKLYPGDVYIERLSLSHLGAAQTQKKCL